MNTNELHGEPLPNIIYLERTLDDARKAAFIRSCDAMLHGRKSGESFGLAVAEFSSHNKPVITSSVHTDGGFASNHLDVLGAKGLYYSSTESLVALLSGFDRQYAAAKDWNAYRRFEPRHVMTTFKKVFLAQADGPQPHDYEDAIRLHAKLMESGARMSCCGK
eukprot:3631079-Prymnesium_polylepis.1